MLQIDRRQSVRSAHRKPVHMDTTAVDMRTREYGEYNAVHADTESQASKLDVRPKSYTSLLHTQDS